MSLYLNDLVLQQEYSIIAGADEVGRGPLAGPVVCAAVVLDPQKDWSSMNDSKKLSHNRREYLSHYIKENALSWHIIEISPSRVDKINVLNASLEGMREALLCLNPIPTVALIDGNRLPPTMPFEAKAIVKGDGIYACIAAASILAKVHRDKIMIEMHNLYPQFGFDRNKGYPTAEHLYCIREYGITPIHRKSFAPVAELVIQFEDSDN